MQGRYCGFAELSNTQLRYAPQFRCGYIRLMCGSRPQPLADLWAVLLDPGEPLSVRHALFGFGQQSPALQRVFEALPHRRATTAVCLPNTLTQLVEARQRITDR